MVYSFPSLALRSNPAVRPSHDLVERDDPGSTLPPKNTAAVPRLVAIRSTRGDAAAGQPPSYTARPLEFGPAVGCIHRHRGRGIGLRAHAVSSVPRIGSRVDVTRIVPQPNHWLGPIVLVAERTQAGRAQQK